MKEVMSVSGLYGIAGIFDNEGRNVFFGGFFVLVIDENWNFKGKVTDEFGEAIIKGAKGKTPSTNINLCNFVKRYIPHSHRTGTASEITYKLEWNSKTELWVGEYTYMEKEKVYTGRTRCKIHYILS